MNELNSQIISEANFRREKMEPWLDEFDSIQSQIEELVSAPEQAPVHEQTRNEFECCYFETLSALINITSANGVKDLSDNISLRSLQGSESSVRENASQLPSVVVAPLIGQPNEVTIINPVPKPRLLQVKLPQLSLPNFSGHIEQWLNFRDMFGSLIHSNDELSPVQKFQYLKSSLSGDAAALIQSLEITAGNYLIAWNLLQEWFENKSRIIHSHVKSLFEMESIPKESYTLLQTLVSNTLTHIRALTTLGQQTQHWDSLLIYLIWSKLDPVTKREWEKLKSELTNLPTMNDLSNFLTKKCQLLESLQNQTKR